jgi:hypothetical protein
MFKHYGRNIHEIILGATHAHIGAEPRGRPGPPDETTAVGAWRTGQPTSIVRERFPTRRSSSTRELLTPRSASARLKAIGATPLGTLGSPFVRAACSHSPSRAALPARREDSDGRHPSETTHTRFGLATSCKLTTYSSARSSRSCSSNSPPAPSATIPPRTRGVGTDAV